MRSENIAIALLGGMTLISAGILIQPDLFRLMAQWHIISGVMQVGEVIDMLITGGIIAIVVGVVLYLLPPTRPMGVRILYGGISAIIAAVLIVVALDVLSGAFTIHDPYIIPMTLLNMAGIQSASAQLLGFFLIMITVIPALGVGALVATITRRTFSTISYAVLAFFFIFDIFLLGPDLGILLWAMLTPAYFLGGLLVSSRYHDIELTQL